MSDMRPPFLPWPAGKGGVSFRPDSHIDIAGNRLDCWRLLTAFCRFG
jgi:hypothetical protein